MNIVETLIFNSHETRLQSEHKKVRHLYYNCSMLESGEVCAES